MYRDSTLEDEEDREPEGEEVHRESQRDIPDPVAPSHPLALGTLCLPVTFITGASLLVYILVFAALRASEGLRELFRLQYVEALAVAAALIAWFVTIRCQRRPGRLFPRIWALGLSLVNTFLAIYLGYELLLGNTVFPLFHAATLAGLASAIALFPRLVRVRPDQRMLQWIGPLTFFGTLLIFVPAGHWLGAKEVQRTGDELRGLMASLDRVSAGLSEVVAHPWESLADAAEPARAQVDLLEGLGTGIDRRFLSPEIWHKAEVVGLDDELSKSLESLYSAVVGGLAPEAGPRLSALDQPAIWYDPERRQWKKSPRFPELSATVGAYAKGFGQVGQRLGLLGEEAAGWPPRVRARAMDGFLGGFSHSRAASADRQARAVLGRALGVADWPELQGGGARCRGYREVDEHSMARSEGMGGARWV